MRLAAKEKETESQSPVDGRCVTAADYVEATRKFIEAYAVAPSVESKQDLVSRIGDCLLEAERAVNVWHARASSDRAELNQMEFASALDHVAQLHEEVAKLPGVDGKTDWSSECIVYDFADEQILKAARLYGKIVEILNCGVWEEKRNECSAKGKQLFEQLADKQRMIAEAAAELAKSFSQDAVGVGNREALMDKAHSVLIGWQEKSRIEQK